MSNAQDTLPAGLPVHPTPLLQLEEFIRQKGTYEFEVSQVFHVCGIHPCQHKPMHGMPGEKCSNDVGFGELCCKGQAVVVVSLHPHFWRVFGRIPLDTAEVLDRMNRSQIRLSGHSGGYSLNEAFAKQQIEEDDNGSKYVDRYDIDTNEALRQFVSVLRERYVIDFT